MGKSKKKEKEKKKSSKKENDKFKKAMKKAGVWNYYQNLSPDQQELTKYNFSIGRADSKDKAKKLSQALDEATKQADPYWRSYLTIAQDELVRAFDTEKQDFNYEKGLLETRIKEIGEDLAKNKDFYTLEQASDLAKLKQSYEQQRDTTIEDAASKGLTFSTNREKPLQQLEEYNKNVVESTNRNYTKKLTDIETEANRGLTETKGQIGNITNKLNASLTDIGRKGEQTLGTSNLPKLDGYNAIGNVSGQMYEDKVKDIEARKQAIFGEKIQSSLNF